METHDPRGRACLEPRDLCRGQMTLPQPKYISCGPPGFREDFKGVFFRYIKSMENLDPRAQGLIGRIYVWDH